MKDYTQFLSDNKFPIFLFHGVIEKQTHAVRNYTKKHIEEARFSEIITSLSKSGVAVSIDQVVEAHQKEYKLSRRSFVITFDDGYENNFSIAAPILKSLNLPAVFYITSNYVDNNQSTWMDNIESLIQENHVLEVQVPFSSKKVICKERDQKIMFLNQVRQYLKYEPSADPYEFTFDLQKQLGVTTISRVCEMDQMMSWDQAKMLHADTFTIGAHSHTHRILEFLPDNELESEIRKCVALIRKHVGISTKHFSYPEGLNHCYSDRVITVLKRHGIVCSPTAEQGVNQSADDLFHLKRITVNE
jgi:peptidoglycan/xylan/chitin deacetylase (PgdA/CDA1 family)